MLVDPGWQVYYNTETSNYYRAEAVRAKRLARSLTVEQGRALLVQQQQPASQTITQKPTRQRGKVKYFVQQRGYGFVSPEASGPDLLVKPPTEGPHLRPGPGLWARSG